MATGARHDRASQARSSVADGGDSGGSGLLFDDGTTAPEVDDWRQRVRELIARAVAPEVEAAERERRFPRRAIAELGRAQLFRERWAGGGHGDLGRSVVLAEELGRAGLGGIGVGLSLHLEAVLGILTRFASTPLACEWRERALDGTAVTCLASSERDAGSDMTAVRSSLSREAHGLRVRGHKWYVSPGGAADVALILCRVGCQEAPPHARTPPLALALVPREQLVVESRLETLGMRGLETVRLSVDALVPEEAVVGTVGRGVLAVSWGLAHERLALAAQMLGGVQLALDLTVTHLHRRRQFGRRLVEHQALRLRIADLAAQVALARRGVHDLAASFAGTRVDMTRQVAGAKVAVARLADHVVGECLHVFGGRGYIEDETPLARMWRDMRVGRLGAGSDEMMWELVAGGLRVDDELYDRMLAGGS